MNKKITFLLLAGAILSILLMILIGCSTPPCSGNKVCTSITTNNNNECTDTQYCGGSGQGCTQWSVENCEKICGPSTDSDCAGKPIAGCTNIVRSNGLPCDLNLHVNCEVKNCAWKS